MAQPLPRCGKVAMTFGTATLTTPTSTTVEVAEDLLRHGLIKNFESKNRDSAVCSGAAPGVTLS